jgi:hypothetical protein
MSTFSAKKFFDPMAQTFYVDTPNGVYITKVGLFFSSKSSTLPVTVEIRPASGSGPDALMVLPDSTVALPPSAVSISADASAETVFEFDEPVYLTPAKWYAIVIKTYASNDYKVWVSKFGDFKLNSTAIRITKDLDPGVFYKSSNSTTWTPDQESDLKYKLYRAKFAGTTATAIFKDANTPKQKLTYNPFFVETGSPDTIIVTHPNHGFQVGDTVNIRGLEASTSYNGITGAELMGSRIINAVDGNGYTFTADADATIFSEFGGGTILASQQYIMDVAQLQTTELNPIGTNVSYTGRFTTSKSFASQSEVAYGYSNVNLVNQKDYYFKQPHVIMTDSNETLNISGVESSIISATFNSPAGTDYVAPAVDLQRASIFAIHNLIDNQSQTPTSGYNTPLAFVDETHRSQGTSLAKHLTKIVTLAEAAYGLKILFDANRPSGTDFGVFYRVLPAGADFQLDTEEWIEHPIDNTMPVDDNPLTYREYRYTIGGDYAGTMDAFLQYQIKIVMTSQSSAVVPKIKSLRTIAMAE